MRHYQRKDMNFKPTLVTIPNELVEKLIRFCQSSNTVDGRSLYQQIKKSCKDGLLEMHNDNIRLKSEVRRLESLIAILQKKIEVQKELAKEEQGQTPSQYWTDYATRLRKQNETLQHQNALLEKLLTKQQREEYQREVSRV